MIDNDAPMPRDHNLTAPPAEMVADQIESALAQFAARRDELVANANNRVVTDNDSIGRAADVRSMIQTLAEAVDARAKEIAQPHLDATSTVRARMEKFLAPALSADGALVQRIAQCRENQRSQAKLQAQQQRDAEAALRDAAGVVSPQIDMAAPVALPAVRGDYGSRVGDRKVTEFTYADPKKLPMAVLKAEVVEKAIQQALRAYHNIHKEIPGVTVSTGLKTSHRRPN